MADAQSEAGWSVVSEEYTLTTAQMLRVAPNEVVSAPLWDVRPADRTAVLHERARRGLLQDDAEPIGDPEYT